MMDAITAILSQPRCAIRNIGVLGYTQGQSLWWYRSPDPLIEVCSPDYFAQAKGMFKTGDMIHISAPDGGMVNYIRVDPSTVSIERLRDGL